MGFCTPVAKPGEISWFCRTSLVPHSLLVHRPDHPITAQIICYFTCMRGTAKTFFFGGGGGARPCWPPGNEDADAAVKATSTNGAPSCDRASETDIRAYIYHVVCSSWQEEWTNIRNNALRCCECETNRSDVPLFLLAHKGRRKFLWNFSALVTFVWCTDFCYGMNKPQRVHSATAYFNWKPSVWRVSHFPSWGLSTGHTSRVTINIQ